MKDRKHPSKAAVMENETKNATKFALINKVYKAPKTNEPKADNTTLAEKAEMAKSRNMDKIHAWLHVAPEQRMILRSAYR